MWTRFLPVRDEIKKVIADGVIGDVLEVSADFCYNNPDHTHHAFVGDGDATTHAAPFKGNGFEEEVEECCRCILAGKVQSDIMHLEHSMAVLRLMD